MKDEQTKILLIEDNPGDARLIREMLSEQSNISFDIRHAERLSEGLNYLSSENLHVVILDLSLPDSKGIETLKKVCSSQFKVPIIVLTGLADEETGLKAIQEGAQDYLIKGHLNAELLRSSMRYAIERYKLMGKLQELSLTDELTGLHNRRGFVTLAEQQLKIADRTKGRLFLLYADIDYMKMINDTFGHIEGDRALVDAANILRMTFRTSDIIARIGGDEFAVFAIETCEAVVLRNRLKKNIDYFNEIMDRPFTLSISAGVASYDAEAPYSLEEMLKKADELMYDDKTSKKLKQKNNDPL